jgi:hypothetical protein
VKQRSGLYPRLSVDDAGSQLVSQAGAVALVDTVRVVGLDTALSAAVGPWRKPLARHDPAKVMLDLALSLAIGGDCLADVAVLRELPAVFGLWRRTRRCPARSTRWPATRRGRGCDQHRPRPGQDTGVAAGRPGRPGLRGGRRRPCGDRRGRHGWSRRTRTRSSRPRRSNGATASTRCAVRRCRFERR